MPDDVRRPDPQAMAGRGLALQTDQFEALSHHHPKAIKVYAEGDSWFAYPRSGLVFGGNANIIQWLQDRPDELLIQSHASSGDEAVAMLSGDSKRDLVAALSAREFDAVLFSGGGNDLVGQYDFDFFLRDRRTVTDWRDGIHHDRLERRLQSVMNAYRDLLDLVQEYSKNKSVPVVTHDYDIPEPTPRGASFVGGFVRSGDGRSWMQPYLDAKHFTDRAEQKQVVRFMLERFAAELGGVAAASGGRLQVVRTQGQLQPHEWLNEIHPGSVGFQIIADKIWFDALQPIRERKFGRG